MKYKSLQDVEKRIDKNFECLCALEKLILLQEDDIKKLELISLIGVMYSEYITGIYASDRLEKYIIDIANRKSLIKLENFKRQKNHVLIVMSKAYYVGGHTALVHNWIKWDDKRNYSIVFTDSNRLDIPQFLEEDVSEAGGKIYCLKGNLLEKGKALADFSQEFDRVLLFTHMNDVVPVIAYGVKDFNVPVYLYNHADFRFSYGFTVADAVLNLCEYDLDKTERFRGVQNENICIPFPKQGKMDVNNINIDVKKIRDKYGIAINDKLIVSMGADFKYENIIGYEFDSYIEKLLDNYSEEKVFFLIIGANPRRKKWIDLEERTGGRAKALGTLERDEAEKIIGASNLYIVSFPMVAAGRAIAEEHNIPSLCLNIIGRDTDVNDVRTANTIDELIQKSIEALSGDRNKYLNLNKDDTLNKDQWNEKWQDVYERDAIHQIQKIYPQRRIEKQEYVNCQLMQESAGMATYNYICSHELSSGIREQLYLIDQEFDMGIFQNDIWKDYNMSLKQAQKNYELYRTSIKWLRIKQRNKKIDQYLKVKGIDTIAIYGMSYMGQTLSDELTEGKIKLIYGIDQNAGFQKWNIPIYKPTDKIPKVDLILNTTTIDNSIILEGMVEKEIPMIKLDTLLDNM